MKVIIGGGGFLPDVREPVELVVERVPDAVNIPLGQRGFKARSITGVMLSRAMLSAR